MALPTPAQAQIDLDVVIGRPPPPERVEVIPAPPRPAGFVWDKGHWRWDGATHVWVPGHYIRLPHPGAVRIPGHWVEMPNGRWRFVRPHWE